MQSATRTALVIGITGSIGREVAEALLRRGWQVRALHRDPSAARMSGARQNAVQWITGDAMQSAMSWRRRAAWNSSCMPPTRRTIAIGAGWRCPCSTTPSPPRGVSNARILLPATVYNFGSDSAPLLKENSPQIPTTRKGQVRVEMELQLQKASLFGVRSIVVRAGDFFGSGAGNSWLTRGMTRARGRVRSVYNPGPLDVGHSWAYLPDLAETMARLIECERPMSTYEVFHFRGHWLDRGGEMAELVCRASGISNQRIKPFPWWAIKLASPFVNPCHEMLEMRYLWQIPLQLDNTKLRALIGAETHTPLDDAVAATLGHRARAIGPESIMAA